MCITTTIHLADVKCRQGRRDGVHASGRVSAPYMGYGRSVVPAMRAGGHPCLASRRPFLLAGMTRRRFPMQKPDKALTRAPALPARPLWARPCGAALAGAALVGAAMAAMLLARESSRSRPWPLPQADEQAGNQKKRTPRLRRSHSSSCCRCGQRAAALRAGLAAAAGVFAAV